jgi:hypothetical protein
MVRKIAVAFFLLGAFSVLASEGLLPDASGAQWYPFYGYHRPSYLGQPCTMTVEQAQPQVSTAYYPPAENATPAVQAVSPQRNGQTQWYPFYGYRRPSYLDR